MINDEYAQVDDPENRLDKVTKAELKGIVNKRLNRDYDFVLLIVGGVGDGKSCLAALACAYVSLLTNRPFDIRNIFFTAYDYKRKKKYLKRRSCLDFDEGEEIFFSRTAMKREQRDMVLKFAQIRAKNHFIVICVPSLLLLEKYLRGIGSETRVSCIWRIVKRGTFLSYSGNTGKLQRIKIDRQNNKVIYPGCDFVGHWKAIPRKSDYWRQYTAEKDQFLEGTDTPEELSALGVTAERVKNSVTQLQAARAIGVTKQSIWNWIQTGKIPKEYVFKDFAGRVRIDKKYFS